ncbi:MAG: hypothetical protein J5776_07170 [Clostridiales bacterium]|nr:hypothetical protein [Clostridiales bacterium]
MAISYPGLLGIYYSDINVRLDMHFYGDSSYSLFILPEFIFVDLFGKSIGAYLIGVYLSIFVVGTVLLVYVLLKKLCPTAKFNHLAVFSFICLIAIPLFIPPFSEKIYGPYVGAVWHNESYLEMRVFALLILLVFFRTNEHYMKAFVLKDFIIECLLFLLVNLAKPNFIIAFAPAMLVMMIIDIIRAGGKGFFNWALYGIPVIVGSLVLPFQYLFLYSGSDGDDSSVVFILGDFILSQKHPILNIVLSFVLPVMIFVMHRKEFLKSRFHLICLLGWFFSFLQYVFIGETGIRRLHENFYWGVRFFSFVMFCLCIGYFLEDIRKYKELKDQNNGNTNSKARAMFFAENMLIIAYTVAGIVYFALILLGARASAL